MALTMTQKRIKKQLDNGTPINSEMINELISDHVSVHNKTLNLYERYKASSSAVPIFSREFSNDATKINSKLNNDFFSEIIDVKVGYMIGKPIVYSLDKNKYALENQNSGLFKKLFNRSAVKTEEDYEKHYDFISRLSILNNFVDIDAELIKLISICGHAGREIFVDKDGEVRVVNIKPWEMIFLTNAFGEVEYALRYYPEEDADGNQVTQVEFFCCGRVQYFEGGSAGFEKTNETEHLFGCCPIVKIVNNEEEIGDVDKVLPLIDGYDRTLSDISSEIEQFRLAYMYFKGKEPDAETIENAKKTGGFYVGENGEVGFITKSINDTVVENHLDRIEKNILRFAKSVNFNDEQFASNLSGVAMQYKLFALESKSNILETKIQAALRNQFRIICNMLNLQNINLDYLDLFFEMSRNIPFNRQDEIQANSAMVGLVSERTRLSELSFVDDVDYELKQMAMDKEMEEKLYSDTPEFNYDNFEDVSTNIETDGEVDNNG